MDPDLHVADFTSKLPLGAISHHVAPIKRFHKQAQIFSNLLGNTTKVTTSITHAPNKVIFKSNKQVRGLLLQTNLMPLIPARTNKRLKLGIRRHVQFNLLDCAANWRGGLEDPSKVSSMMVGGVKAASGDPWNLGWWHLHV